MILKIELIKGCDVTETKKTVRALNGINGKIWEIKEWNIETPVSYKLLANGVVSNLHGSSKDRTKYYCNKKLFWWDLLLIFTGLFEAKLFDAEY